VLGTSFRVEVIPMSKRALVGAAAATTVVVAVYTGSVVFKNGHGDIELEAGHSASATPGAAPSSRPTRLAADLGATKGGPAASRDAAINDTGEEQAEQAVRAIPRLPERTEEPFVLAPASEEKPIPSHATRAAMEQVRPLLAECYGLVAHEWPGLAGESHRLAVRFHVIADPDHGAVVEDASVEGHPLALDPTFSECITETVSTIGRYLPPPMVEGGMGIVYPLELE
jgi:hypothetical protein